MIALQAQTDRPEKEVKILPVTISYSQPYPSWGTKVKVNIGSPLTVNKYLDKSLRRSSQKLTNALQETLQKLYKSLNWF